jgi:predicted kinase
MPEAVADIADRYFVELAAAFVRGRRADAPDLLAAVAWGRDAGLGPRRGPAPAWRLDWDLRLGARPGARCRRASATSCSWPRCCTTCPSRRARAPSRTATSARADTRAGAACTRARSCLIAYHQVRGCWQAPWPFASDHARFLYFRSAGRGGGRSLHAPAHDDTRLEVTVMSGLPGAGKDHWIATHARDLPVVSLDALREELEVDPAGDQGSVVKAAYERARHHLRGATPFVWNATNVSRVLRQRVIDFVADYRARVRVVYVEAPAQRILDRNRGRAQAVPAHVIDRLVRRWTMPTPREAHTLLLAVEAPARPRGDRPASGRRRAVDRPARQWRARSHLGRK